MDGNKDILMAMHIRDRMKFMKVELDEHKVTLDRLYKHMEMVESAIKDYFKE